MTESLTNLDRGGTRGLRREACRDDIQFSEIHVEDGVQPGGDEDQGCQQVKSVLKVPSSPAQQALCERRGLVVSSSGCSASSIIDSSPSRVAQLQASPRRSFPWQGDQRLPKKTPPGA
jgi:hypothetical protein